MLRLADELALQPGASAESMSDLQARFSQSEVIEFLVTGAYYCRVARVVNSVGLGLEKGHEGLRARQTDSNELKPI